MTEQLEGIEAGGKLDRAVTVLAKFVVAKRLFILAVLVLTTLFWGYQLLSINVQTFFPDLLPKHAYVDLVKEYPDFGGANMVLVEIKVKEGDVFNTNTLDKIIKLSEDLQFIPGIDRNKVVSIGVGKIKNFKVTAWGIEFPSLMYPDAPTTEEAIEELKVNVYSNSLYYGRFVSIDSKSALIMTEFFNEGVEYEEVYNIIQDLIAKYSDDNNELFIVGGPYLYGVVSHYLPQTTNVLIVTGIVMLLLAFIYTRSVRLTLMPMMSAAICGIWGLGFLCLMGYNLDPLILVVPLLVSARALSHSIQFNWRVHEEYATRNNLEEACEASIRGLFYPGVAGIVTDGMGILLIAFIPIPIMMKLGLVIFVWSMAMIFVVLILNPILYMYLPKMKNVHEWREKKQGGMMEGIMARVARTGRGKGAYVVVAIAFILAVVSGYYSLQLQVGDVYPGTPILKESSSYNQSCGVLATDFPGLMDPLIIVARYDGERGIVKRKLLDKIAEFQFFMMQNPLIKASVSIADLMKNLYLRYMQNDPKHFILPDSDPGVGAMLFLLMGGGAEPGDFDMYYTPDNTAANVLFYCTDHTTATIKEVFAACTEFISKAEAEDENLHFDLAAGSVGIVAATNVVVERDQLALLIAAFAITYVFCAFFFQSFTAAFLLLIPLALSNLIVFGYMGYIGLGLNIQTLPVSTIAVGIGVDYGIYLLSRIKEETARLGTLDEGITEAIRTAGNAITITALIIIAGVAFWFISDIKFQSDMGFLLSLVTFFHLLGTLFFLPTLVVMVKPKFIMNKIAG
ncbi:MAG: MMPL family transporter [Deltaproteobacteria bacterium]|nr:MMPL family transporter [Deltaproteobacteria bacterium]